MEDIPGLASAMFENAALVEEGIFFSVLGDHHSAFEVTLTTKEIGPFLNRDVLNDLRPQPGGKVCAD